MHVLPPFHNLAFSFLLLVAAQFSISHANTQNLPTAIRQMGLDAGEKFLDQYCAFSESDAVGQIGSYTSQPLPAAIQDSNDEVLSFDEKTLMEANASAALTFRAPFAVLSSAVLCRRAGWLVQENTPLLQRRDYSCPRGTSDCAAIGYPSSCCQTGTTCVRITDTGLGAVGCCPEGETCTGTIACAGGQQGCPSESGGGCCIPGYSCASFGCTQEAAAIATAISPSNSSSSSSGGVTTNESINQQTPTSTIPSTSTTNQASAPVRPTSGDTTMATSTSTGFCPTGFYACSAVHGGGCCQTGRNCQVTSCPSTAYSTITLDGATVAVPAPDDPIATTDGMCAGGWTMCPIDTGGAAAGCCPLGYDCGSASCFLATSSATARVAKELPSGGDATGREARAVELWLVVPLSVGLYLGTLWL